AIRPRTDRDRTRLARGLNALTVDDSTIVLHSCTPEESIVGGTDERHLEGLLDRLRIEFGVEATIGPLRIAYKETITIAADGAATYVNRSAQRDEYAHCKVHLFPGARGSGCAFESVLGEDVMPRPFLGAIFDGAREAFAKGVLAGYPVD